LPRSYHSALARHNSRFAIAAVLYALGAAPVSAATGREIPELAELDRLMAALMTKWKLPGGQLAVAKDGTIVLSRGYGHADPDRGTLVQPDSLFRTGSVAKTLTAVAVLTLVDRGKLRLDDKAFTILSDLKPAAGATVDPRLHDITVRNLLQHAAGWDNAQSFSPLELPWSRMAAATIGEKDPPECATVIRYMMGVPLDFAPGTRTAYSNFGYCVLGRIIEARAEGKPSYDEYVKRHVLQPAGITRMQLAGTRESERAPGEVRYIAQPGRPRVPSVFFGEGYVPFAYGGIYLRGTDASGGWIASAEDLVRFAMAVPALLRPETFRQMLETPVPNSREMGLCWTVAQRKNGVDFWHTGAIADSNANWLVRTHDGVTLAFAFNSLPADPAAFFRDALPAFLDALAAVRVWPRSGARR
jgi:CubicO group peptidase (beta-lactamase class C family)